MFCMGNGSDEAPRHGTDIGAAVPADFSFIMDTAQRNTGEFLSSARAIERAKLVLPTPGGPTKQ